jgi:hypothetical protein
VVWRLDSGPREAGHFFFYLGAVWRVGGPRARESWPSDSVFSASSSGRLGCSSTAAVGPSRKRPSRCDGVYPSVSQSVVDHFSGFDTSMWRSRSMFLSSVFVLWVVLGRVDDPLQPAREYSWAVTRVDVPIQPASLFYLSFLFLPMISRDHSLALFLYINEIRIILWFVKKKKGTESKLELCHVPRRVQCPRNDFLSKVLTKTKGCRESFFF